MRRLTEQEIKFLKETGWTPTKYQMNSDVEYKNAKLQKPADVADWNDYYEQVAQEQYGIDLSALYNKCVEENDAISLENEAPYIMSILLDFETLDEFAFDGRKALDWLQGWQYFFGYRKSDEFEAANWANLAIDIKRGAVLAQEYDDIDDSIWLFDLDGELI